MEGLVGRDEALRRLLQVIQSTESSSLSVVLGDAGLGKTRFLGELRRTVDDRQPIDVTVSDRWLDPLAWLQPMLRSLGAPPIPDDDTLTAEERRWDIVARLSEAIATAGPLLITIDDLHKADAIAFWVLDELRKATARSDTALVLATRPSSQPGLEQLLRVATVIELDPLDLGAIEELVEARGLELDAATVMAITGGSPLLIDQLGRGGDPSARGIDILSTRIETLPDDTREVLALMALSRFAPSAVIAAASGRTPSEIDALLEPARRINAVDVRNTFIHDLIVEAALAGSAPHNLQQLHSRLADAWSRIGTTDSDVEAGRHRMWAVPLVDGAAAIDGAIELAERLTSSMRPEAAISLLELTTDVLERHLAADPGRRAAVLVATADARWALGETLQSVELGAAASELLTGSDDPMLTAQAELAATRQHDTIQPDHERLDRVLNAARALARDDPLRVRLLGRASVLSMTALDIERAHQLADEGIDFARRLGDVELEVQLLTDRHLCVIDRAGAEVREQHAQSIIGMAAQAARSDLALVGHQWVAGGHVLRGDLDGATEELDRLEIRAALRTPTWQLVVAFRRMTILGMRGPKDRALRKASDTWARFGHLLGEAERPGVEHEYRAALARLYGVTDPEIAELHERLYSRPLPPVPFISIRSGSLPLMEGDLDTVRALAQRWAPRSTAVVRSFMGLPTMAILASMTAALGDPDLCRPVVEALDPFSGLLATDNGIGVNPPVDTLIAANLLHFDLERAAEYARRGVELATSAHADPLLGRALSVELAVRERRGDPTSELEGALVTIAASAGMPLRPDTASEQPASAREGIIRREDAEWHISSPYGSAVVAHTRGVEQLTTVLGANGTDLAATELAAPGSAIPDNDLGPALDATAKRAYRRRIIDLEAEIEEAQRYNDPGRSERARVELDLIMAELRSAVGLGGRDRPQRSGDERARVNVTRSIRRAIDSVTDALPDLGAHLSISVNTGRYCSYRPDPAAAIDWRVDH